MEIEGTDGCKTLIKQGQTREFGRGQGFNSTDKTISRHHVAFSLPENETRVHFQVIGKNPIWVHSSKNDEVKAFRSSKKGEMESGVMFCMSAKNPIWFTLKKTEIEGANVEEKEVVGENENEVKRELGLECELAESLQSGSGPKGVEELDPESVDISGIDPIKEFEFVVMGHEFDRYPKIMIRDIKDFDWFLEGPGEDRDDDDKKVKKGGRRKRKKGEENDDEEWTGESEDDKEVITKSRNVQRPKYTTRSKDRHKSDKDTSKSKRTTGMKSRNVDDKCEEDEDDDTLGGFIVSDEDSEQDDDIDEEEELDNEFDEENDE
ncbi:SMAD/FHA domain-containing protein [Abeliophyllum distichum]|uniref:SMAD/FHA domain-containing protein n=1 Tax=Abeliophyllum distichum TaxID=126358 RepID=A0ABD1VP67_9LAMI